MNIMAIFEITMSINCIIQIANNNEIRAQKLASLKKFEDASSGISSASNVSFTAKKDLSVIESRAKDGNSLALVVLKKEIGENAMQNAHQRVSSVNDTRSEEERKKLDHNYWLPHFTPEAAVIVKKVPLLYLHN